MNNPLQNIEWMSFNIFLASLPFVLSFFLFRKDQKISIIWLFGLFVFIIFLPNAPYVLTDLMHLYKGTAPESIKFVVTVVWQYIILILAGCALFAESFKRFEQFALSRVKINFHIFRVIVFLILSIGVYLGRFLRLNSWDVFLKPTYVLENLNALLNIDAVFYIGLFTTLLILIYYIYENLHLQDKNVVMKAKTSNYKKKRNPPAAKGRKRR